MRNSTTHVGDRVFQNRLRIRCITRRTTSNENIKHSSQILFLLLQGSQHPENEPDVFRYLPSEQVGRTTAGDMRTLCKSSANGCLQSARENHTVAATSSDEQVQKCSCSHYRMRSHPVKLRAQLAQLRQQRPLASELLQALEVMGLRHCWIRQGPLTLRHDVKTAA